MLCVPNLRSGTIRCDVFGMKWTSNNESWGCLQVSGRVLRARARSTFKPLHRVCTQAILIYSYANVTPCYEGKLLCTIHFKCANWHFFSPCLWCYPASCVQFVRLLCCHYHMYKRASLWHVLHNPVPQYEVYHCKVRLQLEFIRLQVEPCRSSLVVTAVKA